MEPVDSLILFIIGTLLTTWLVAFAYKNTKFVLKHKIAQKREEAVTRDVMRAIGDDKKMQKKEKDERILWKKNEVADYEATTFSIFYNNSLFLAIVCVSSFLICASLSPSVNYILSVVGAGGLIALFSTGSK